MMIAAENELRRSEFERDVDDLLESRRGVIDPDRISVITKDLVAKGLREAHERYGQPGTPNYLHYHNEQHTRDVVNDTLDLGIIALDLDNAKYQFADIHNTEHRQLMRAEEAARYELLEDAMLGAAWHDVVQELGSGDNEYASAQRIQAEMEAHGYPVHRQTRVMNTIFATQVDVDEKGRLIQPYVEYGQPDPAVLAVALADTHGITMHGVRTMIDHSLRLAMEQKHLSFGQLQQDVGDFVTMLRQQYQFVGTRLDTVESNIRYHITDSAEADRVVAAVADRYATSSSRAIRTAKSMFELLEQPSNDVISALGKLALGSDTTTSFVSQTAEYVTACAKRRLGQRQSDK